MLHLEDVYMKIGSKKWESILRDSLKNLHLEVNIEQIRQMTVHSEEMLKWNQRINLTAIIDPMEVAVKHFIDSAVLAKSIQPDLRLIDIGSGGGFPGVVLKCLIPSLSVTLIDASRKKVNFLKHIIRTLDLKEIEAIHIRAEDLAKKVDYSKCFDVVVCRAFSSLDTFIRLALPFVAENGFMAAMKGKDFESEIEILKEYDLNLDLKRYSLPYLGQQRSIFFLK